MGPGEAPSSEQKKKNCSQSIYSIGTYHDATVKAPRLELKYQKYLLLQTSVSCPGTCLHQRFRAQALQEFLLLSLEEAVVKPIPEFGRAEGLF